MAWITVETDTDRICPGRVIEGGQVIVKPFGGCLIGPGEQVFCEVISGETALETITIPCPISKAFRSYVHLYSSK